MDESVPAGALRLPSAHRLRAALRAARILNPKGTPLTALRDAYVELPSGGIFYSEDLAAGEDLLRSAQLVTVAHGTVLPSQRLLDLIALDEAEACEVLLAILLTVDPPLWLGAATRDGELRVEAIPEGATLTLFDLLPDPDRREAMLLALARRHEKEARAALGALGEEHVVAACQQRLCDAGHEQLAGGVHRVSKISDQLGYDVTEPRPAGGKGRYEVKTTRGVGSLVDIHLSRNEARTGLRDPNWALVVCRADHENVVAVAGWCRAHQIENLLPHDSEDGGRWENAVLTLQLEEVLTPGLPPLE